MIIALDVLSLILTLCTITLFFGLHIVGKEYSILQHAVSDYAIGKTARLFLIYIAIAQIAYLALVAAIWMSSFATFSLKTAILLLLVIIFRIGLAIFKTDLEGQKLTTSGIIHYLFAILSFAALYMVADSAATDLRHIPELSGAFNIATPLLWIFTAALVMVCITIIPRLRRIFGLFERAFLLLGNVWILLIAGVMLTRV